MLNVTSGLFNKHRTLALVGSDDTDVAYRTKSRTEKPKRMKRLQPLRVRLIVLAP